MRGLSRLLFHIFEIFHVGFTLRRFVQFVNTSGDREAIGPSFSDSFSPPVRGEFWCPGHLFLPGGEWVFG